MTNHKHTLHTLITRLDSLTHHWSKNRVEDQDTLAHVMTSVVLDSNQGKYIKIVQLNIFTNVAVMCSCPRFRTAQKASHPAVISIGEHEEDDKGHTTSVFGLPCTKMLLPVRGRYTQRCHPVSLTHYTRHVLQHSATCRQDMRKQSSHTSHHSSYTKLGTIPHPWKDAMTECYQLSP